MATDNQKLKKEFVRWSLLSDSDKGELDSIVSWAKAKGVSERTVRRWKSEEWFSEAVESYVTDVTPGVEPVEDDIEEELSDALESSGDEADYLEVKKALIAGARQGNPKYLDLYFKTYGKPFVEEEVAARSTDLSGMDLDQLVTEALLALGPELVAESLRLQGWSVKAPQ